MITPPVITEPGIARAFAALVLFTVTPTDRALAGWDPSGWADEEADALKRYVAAARKEAA